MDTTEILNNSLCKNCSHTLSRTISTEGLMIYDIDDGVSDVNFVIPEDATDFEIHSCVILCTDLDHIVLACSKFSEKISNFEIKNKLIYSNDVEEGDC